MGPRCLSACGHSQTIGSPIASSSATAHLAELGGALPVETFEGAAEKKPPSCAPRPRHADLAGALKYDFHDRANILERASARETGCARSAGCIGQGLLGHSESLY